MSSTPTKKRKRNLRHIHYETARGIEQMFSGRNLKATLDEKAGMIKRLFRLSYEAGTETDEAANQLGQESGRDASGVKPNERYLAAIRALLDKGEADHSDVILEIQDDALTFGSRLWEKQREDREAKEKAREQAAAKPKRRTITFDENWRADDHILGTGDEVVLEEVSPDDLHIGDLVLLTQERGGDEV